MSLNYAPLPQGLDEIVPPELIAHFLDFLDLSDLLRVLAVNKRWRDLALEHPTYWRDLSLDEFQTMEPAHVRLFRLRLSRSRNRPVNVVLRYLPYEPSELQLLPHVAQHLPHMQNLEYLSGDDDIHEALFDALAGPAPILCTLSLTIRRSDHPVAIRADLLAGFSPRLQRVTIGNADLPSPVPDCLRTVERLSLVSARVPDLTQGCPLLQELRLCHNVTLHPEYLEERAWREIRLVCFDGGTIALDWHSRNLAVARVPTVIVRAVYTSGLGDPESAESLAALATHVRGGIGVHVVRQAPHQLWVDLRGTAEESSALERGAMLVNQQFPEARTAPLPFPGNNLAIGFSGRITYMSVDLASWEVALCLGQLPNLQALVLLLKENGPAVENPGQLFCHCLQRLVLRGPDSQAESITVSLAPFAQFARCALVAASFPLALELQNVQLLPVEDPDCPSSTFRSTTTTKYRGDHRWL